MTNYGGGYLNGYELINGTNNNVGGFIVKGDVIKNKNGTYTANIYFEFNDIIDPNNSFEMDSLLSSLSEMSGYNCNDFYFKAGRFYVYEYSS